MTATRRLVLAALILMLVAGMAAGTSTTNEIYEDGEISVSTLQVTRFAIESATFTQNQSISAQVDSQRGIAFNDDGTKFFVTDVTNDDVSEYSLSTPYDITTLSHQDTLSVENTPQGLTFNSDGTKLYIVHNAGTGRNITSYSLTTGYDLSTASKLNVFSPAEFQSPTGIDFGDSGSSMIVSDVNSDNILYFTLTSSFDITTASHQGNLSVGTEEGLPRQPVYGPTGDQIYLTGNGNDNVYEYDLTTTWDATTGSFNTSKDISSEGGSPVGLAFNPDGSQMFISDLQNDEIDEYDLSVPATPTPTATATATATATPAPPQAGAGEVNPLFDVFVSAEDLNAQLVSIDSVTTAFAFMVFGLLFMFAFLALKFRSVVVGVLWLFMGLALILAILVDTSLVYFWIATALAFMGTVLAFGEASRG